MTKRWQEMLLTGQPGELEARLRRSDGVYRWFLIRAEPFVTPPGTSSDGTVPARTSMIGNGERKPFARASSVSVSSSMVSRDWWPSCRQPARPRQSTGEPWSISARRLNSGNAGRPATRCTLMTCLMCGLPGCARLTRCPSTMWITGFVALTAYIDGSMHEAFRFVTRRPARSAGTYFSPTSTIASKPKRKAQHSEAVLAESQRLSLTGSFTWRVESDEVTWSRQLYRIFGFDQSVPVNLELFSKRVHPQDLPMFNEQIERSRKDGSDMEFRSACGCRTIRSNICTSPPTIGMMAPIRNTLARFRM